MAGEMSENIGEIAAALAKAQAGLGKLVSDKIVKNRDGSTRYTYADLADALRVCLGVLAAEGIAVLQMPATPEGNGVTVTTMLAHSSGQWIRSEPLFMPVSGGAQDVGSAITYARRYQLLAMVGLAPEDDDGAAAQKAKPDSWGGRKTQSTRKDDDLGPRCSGQRGAPISAANERRMRMLVDEDPEAEMGDVWHWALKSAEIDVRRYGGSGPGTAQGLTIPDGIKLRKILTEKCISLGLEQVEP